MSYFDPYGFFGTIFWVVICAVFIMVVKAQYAVIKGESYSMILLALRGCSLLPIFMTFILMSLWAPYYFAMFKVPAAVFEGYGVYCMWALMVRQCGGAKPSSGVIQRSKRAICWNLNTPELAETFYHNANTAIWQFAMVRPAIIAFGTIFFYAEVQAIYLVCTVLGAVSTLYMLPYLFLSAHVLLDECNGLNILVKLALVKVSVGLILIEDVVQQFMYQSNVVDLNNEDGLEGYSEESKYVRVYTTIALAEGVLLAAVMYFGFAPEMSISVAAKERAEAEKSDPSLDVPVSCIGDFVYDLCNVYYYPCNAVVNYPPADDDSNSNKKTLVGGSTIHNALLDAA